MAEGVLRVKKLHFEWSIEKFSSRRETTGKSIESPAFVCNGTDQLKLKLYPNGDKEKLKLDMNEMAKVKEHVSLFLYAASGVKWTGQFEFAIINHCGRKCNCETFQRLIPTVGYGFPEFISRTELFNTCELLPNDTLTISCQVKDISGCPVDSKQAQLQVATDLEQLIGRDTLSDVCLLAEGRKFHAHRAILSARSPVFAAMFETPPENADVGHAKSTVDVHDLESDVLEEMLRFIYTGRVTQLELMAEKLLCAATRYELRNLKALCEEEMMRKLSVENAARTLIQSDKNTAKRLKMKTILFINSHSPDVIETTGWKEMVESHPKLIAEIYVKLVKK